MTAQDQLRRMTTEHGDFCWQEPVAHCDRCGRAFFPLRTVLRIEGGRFSPTVIDKLVDAGGSACSYKEAARVVHKQAGIKVSPAQIERLVQQIGDELWQRRAAEAALHQRRELPSPADQPPVEIACVQIDGGRILTRAADQGRGVHDEAWKESKVAALWKLSTVVEGCRSRRAWWSR